jgi:hypothetical protein
MKEVVWVVGTSSAGKQTFIKNVLTDVDLAKRLGWQHKKVVICQRSVDFPGDLGKPEIVRARKLIPDDVSGLLVNSDVVLIKWQYVDSSCELPQRLKELLPTARHRIILLRASPRELAVRLSSKDWWREMGFKDANELVGYELKMVDKFISELQDQFEITIIDSGARGHYKQS